MDLYADIKKLKELEKVISYEFKDITLLQMALTNNSFVNENKGKYKTLSSYQRLEFLGDSIVNFIVADYLYDNYKDDEGILTEKRSQVVDADFLANLCDKYNFMDYVLYGKAGKPDILSKHTKGSIVESIIGAVYKDSGSIQEVKRIFLFGDFSTDLKQNLQSDQSNYVGKFKEWIEKQGFIKSETMSFDDFFIYDYDEKAKIHICTLTFLEKTFKCNGEKKKYAQQECCRNACVYYKIR